MEIRKATLKDNLYEIATLIYKTDKFIYPYWFRGESEYQTTLIDIIKTKGSLFYYKNIWVATQDEHVYGILICFDEKTDMSCDYNKWLNKNRFYKRVFKKYILPTSKHQKQGFVYISNVCVAEKYRRRHIGKQLLENLFEKYPNKNFELAAVAKNTPAMKLYTKQGFEIVETLKGFNGPLSRKPKIHNMTKIKK